MPITVRSPRLEWCSWSRTVQIRRAGDHLLRVQLKRLLPVEVEIAEPAPHPLTLQATCQSEEGGETWTQGGALSGPDCCDPTLAWSSDGTIGYTATLWLPELYFYRVD